MSPKMCVLWVASDVLMCSASIWHMCTMSMDRYFTLNYPMRYGRNKTRRMVAGKIFFVWAVSVSIALPICIYGFVDSSIVYNDGACVPVLKNFIIWGSIFAFYIPLLIMLVTYILTIRILWRNEHRMQQIDRSDFKPRLAQLTAQCTGFAIPKFVSSMKKPTRAGGKSVGAGHLPSSHHGQSQSNPSLVMYATGNHRRYNYLPFLKKYSSQPKVGISVSFNKESQFMCHSGRGDPFQNQNSRLDRSERTLANSQDRLSANDISGSFGIKYLRPPSSLTHSGMSTSPLSSQSTLTSPLHSPYACDEYDDICGKDDENTGRQSRGSTHLKSPASPSCRSLSSPLSFNGYDKSLQRRLQRRQLYLSQQKQSHQLKHGTPREQQELEPIQNQEDPHHTTLLQQQHLEIRDKGQVSGGSSCTHSSSGRNDCVNQPHSGNMEIHQCKFGTSQSIDASGCLECNNDLFETEDFTPQPVCAKNVDSLPKDRTAFPSSISTPSISLFHHKCNHDAPDYTHSTQLCDSLQEQTSNNSSGKELPHTHPYSVSTKSALIRSTSELLQSSSTKPTSQSTKTKKTQPENGRNITSSYSPNSSGKTKRFSKRSKKNKKSFGSQKGRGSPDIDHFLCGSLNQGRPQQNEWFLQLPSQNLLRYQHTDRQTARLGGMTAAVSDTCVSHEQFSERRGKDNCGNEKAGFPSVSLGCRRPKLDYQSMEWDRRYFQIQEEMDRCLSGEITGSSGSERGHTTTFDLMTRDMACGGRDCSTDVLNIQGDCDVSQRSRSAPASPMSNKGHARLTIPLLSFTADEVCDNGTDDEEEDDVDGIERCVHNSDDIEDKKIGYSIPLKRKNPAEGLGKCVESGDSEEGHQGDDDDDSDDEDDDIEGEDENDTSDYSRLHNKFSLMLSTKDEFLQVENMPLYSSTDLLLAESNRLNKIEYQSKSLSGFENKAASNVVICLHPPSPKSSSTFLHSDSNTSCNYLVNRQDKSPALNQEIPLKDCSSTEFCSKALLKLSENKHVIEVSSSKPNVDIVCTCDDKVSLSVAHETKSDDSLSLQYNCNCCSCSQRSPNVINNKSSTSRTDRKVENQKSNNTKRSSMSDNGSEDRREHPQHTNIAGSTISNTAHYTTDTLLFPSESSYNGLGGEQVISSEGEITLEETDDTLDGEHNSNVFKLRRPKTGRSQPRYQKRQQASSRNADSVKAKSSCRKRPSFKKSFLQTHRGKAPDTGKFVGGKTKHVLSKKTASNERKASKVLGIIFMVFVTLWTPFFTVNVLSATCETCIQSVTDEMMALFLWMGYIASLANPIIYTMFNTAFRRTFIRILTCKMKRSCTSGGVYAGATRSTNDGGGTTGYNYMSYTTVLASERRNTMSALLRDESR
ncbi:5-hydroxytryptamine receptor 2A [Elysia marginata]|uniref:5-hydroxytryptamine receptor 2A n=1 Tax=Elysia marginata TaxID=1093978 RepID=A0AAV4JML4_9GAST|nr:5-hydroxytryptamine receptor 2A [Elysia marginata]